MAKNATATISPPPNVAHLNLNLATSAHAPKSPTSCPVPMSLIPRSGGRKFSIKMGSGFVPPPRSIKTIFKVKRAKMGPQRLELFIYNRTKDVHIIANDANIVHIHNKNTLHTLYSLVDKAPDKAFMYGVVEGHYLHLLLDEGLAPHQLW